MLKQLNFIIFISLITFIANCYSFEIHSPDTKDYALSGNTASCKEVKELKQWKFLYGTVNLSNPSPDEIFGDLSANKAYYIEETVVPGDVVISILLGLFTSISKNTIKVYECGNSKIKKTSSSNSSPKKYKKYTKQRVRWVERECIVNGRIYKRYVRIIENIE